MRPQLVRISVRFPILVKIKRTNKKRYQYDMMRFCSVTKSYYLISDLKGDITHEAVRQILGILLTHKK